MQANDKNWLIGFIFGALLMYGAAKLDLYMLSKGHQRWNYNQQKGNQHSEPHGNFKAHDEDSQSNKHKSENN